MDANSKRSSSLQVVTEMIVRTALERRAAVLYLSEVMKDSALEDVYNSVLHHYGVPLLSYRSVALPDIQSYVSQPQHRFPPQWAAPKHSMHPAWPTHVLLAQTVAQFFTVVAARLSSVTISQRALPEPLFAIIEDDVSHCSPVLISISSDKTSFAHQPFIPYQIKGQNVDYYPGWQFVGDFSGEPGGWVSETRRTNITAISRLVFEVALAQGEISISYLGSYRNAGQLEIWLSSHDAGARNGKQRGTGEVLGCCDGSKMQRAG